LIEIVRQGGEMMEAALDDKDILGAIGERQPAAIGDQASGGAFELREEAGREVHAFDAGETETLESDQTVSTAAEKFDNFRVARPLTGAQSMEARDKLLNFLFWRFKTKIRCFPGIRR
jgi:hypothetical protein